MVSVKLRPFSDQNGKFYDSLSDQKTTHTPSLPPPPRSLTQSSPPSENLFYSHANHIPRYNTPNSWPARRCRFTRDAWRFVIFLFNIFLQQGIEVKTDLAWLGLMHLWLVPRTVDKSGLELFDAVEPRFIWSIFRPYYNSGPLTGKYTIGKTSYGE